MAFVAGQKVRASELNDAGIQGLLAWGKRTTPSALTTAGTQATALKVMEISASVLGGRQYRISCPNLGVFSADPAQAEVALAYTTNNTAPTPTSTQLVKTVAAVPDIGIPYSFELSMIYPSASAHTLRLLLTIFRVSGTAAVQTYADNISWPTIISVEDIGPTVAPAQTLF